LTNKVLFTFFREIEFTILLPLGYFQSRFDNFPFRTINHQGTREISGSEELNLKKVVMGINTIQQSFIHINIDDLAPPST
jgi:hypothetical protein